MILTLHTDLHIYLKFTTIRGVQTNKKTMLFVHVQIACFIMQQFKHFTIMFWIMF